MTESSSCASSRTAILIVGMHRSGTSALTRIINLLGADLPVNLLPPQKDNILGFWESADICRLNEDILLSLGSSWDDWRGLRSVGSQLPVDDAFRKRAFDLLIQNFSDSSLFVLKDPRFCRLMPFWLDIFQEENIEVKCILPLRNPLEVASSLENRNGFHRGKSIVLWLRHVLDAEGWSRGLSRVFITYKELLDDWQSTIDRVERELKLVWPHPPRGIEDEINLFLKRSHRHHIIDESAILRDAQVGVWTIETYSALLKLQEDSKSKSVLDKLDDIRTGFNLASDLFGVVIQAEEKTKEDLKAKTNRHKISLEQSLSERDTQLVALEQLLLERDAQLVALEQLLSERDAQLVALEQTLSERDSRLADMRLTLTTIQNEKDDVLQLKNQLLSHLNKIQTCASWQLSRPFHFMEYRWPSLVRCLAAIPKVCYWSLTFRLPLRLRLGRQAKQILTTGLFDLQWYLSRNPDIILHGSNPVLHWLDVGWKEGRDPNVLFETNWYLEQNPDVAESGVNPLIHYLLHGAAEGRDPSPRFDSKQYLVEHPEIIKDDVNPLAHYLGSVKRYGICHCAHMRKEKNSNDCNKLGANRGAESQRETAPVEIVYIVNEYDLMTQLYRVSNYSVALAAVGYECLVICENEIVDDVIIRADVLILNRIVWTPFIDTLIQKFKESGRPVFFDIDDFVFDSSRVDLFRPFEKYNDLEKHYFLQLLEGLSKTMHLADAVTVSTFALLEQVEKCGLSAYILPNSIGMAQSELVEKISVQKGPQSTNKILRIGYFSGTKTHEHDFEECSDALLALLVQYPQIELVVVGHLDLPASFSEVEKQICRKPLMSHNDMLVELATIDINLAPLEQNNVFTDCKSELKIFEAALLGIPTIASPTTTFAATIAHGRNGFLAATTEEWYNALRLLIEDNKLRFQIGVAARNEIAARFSIETTLHEAKAIFDSAVHQSLRQRSAPLPDLSPSGSRSLITIVSILYQKEREVRYFLEAIRRQDFSGRIEVLLVDDKTPDDSVAVVRDFIKWFGQSLKEKEIEIRILSNEKNIGNCGSRNLAIDQAHGDIIIVVDADCMLNRSFLSSHYNAFLKGDADVCIGPINIETHGNPPFSVLGQHDATVSIAEEEKLQQDSVNMSSFVNCITRNFSIKREFLHETFQDHLFDDAFSYSSDPQSGFGWEDVEMGYRLYLSGARIKYLPDTASIHITHLSSTNESKKPLRSLRNFRRLLEKHPLILTASRQWCIKTYDAILEWLRSVDAKLEKNDDYLLLERRFRRYRQAPIIIDRTTKKLRILTYRWHVPHQYELYKTGHDFTLVTNAGTGFCDFWEFAKRPMPENCCMKPVEEIDPKDFDLAILHFDENLLRPDLCHGLVPEDWGKTFHWFIDNVDLPKVAICHGTPQFIGQYDREYVGSDLGKILDEGRKAVVDYLGDILVVCNSYQAQSEWNFKNSRTIWHGFAPSEFPPGSGDRGVLVMQSLALQNRPHYNGLFVYEGVKSIIGGQVNLNCLQTPDPTSRYEKETGAWAVAKYQNYVRELGAHSVYFNTTVRSPMPRARGEAMMAGLVSVSLRNHDVDLFIKNGSNGFYADSNEELADQILWLLKRPHGREKMSQASRKTAMDIFNQDRYLSSWSQLLDAIAAGKES